MGELLGQVDGSRLRRLLGASREAIRAVLRLLEDDEAALQEVRSGLREGLAQASQGETLDGKAAIEQAFAKALAKSRK